MILTERLLYGIDFKLNKVSSGQGQNISVPDKILTLNEAQLRVIKKKVGLNNLYKLGFDAFKARYEELQNLVVQYEEVVPTKTTESFASYEIDLNSLKSKYFLPVDIIAIGSRDKCKDRVISIPRVVKHSELQSFLHNEHFCPSFIWQETVAVISADKLIIYVNDPDGEFELSKVKISYLRYPVKVDYEGYEHFDGTLSTTVDCELSEILEDELLEMSVIELAYNTGNINGAQAAQQKSLNSEL